MARGRWGPTSRPRTPSRGYADSATVDERIDEAWRLLTQARESGRFNPRRSRPAGLDDLVRTLHLLEQAVAGHAEHGPHPRHER